MSRTSQSTPWVHTPVQRISLTPKLFLSSRSCAQGPSPLGCPLYQGTLAADVPSIHFQLPLLNFKPIKARRMLVVLMLPRRNLQIQSVCDLISHVCCSELVICFMLTTFYQQCLVLQLLQTSEAKKDVLFANT